MRIFLFGASGTLGSALMKVFSEASIEVISIGRHPSVGHEFHYCDLVNLESINESITTLPSLEKGDVVIINSGIIGPVSNAIDVDLGGFRDAISVNALSNLPIFQSVYKKGGIKYIVVSSGAALKKYSGWLSYCVSKSLQYSLWEAISRDRDDVSIKLIAPGVLNSDMHLFTNIVSRDEFPDLDKFFQIKEQGSYQDPCVSAKKILSLINEANFFSSGFEYIDLREI